MNETKWLASRRPQTMLDLLGSASSDYWRQMQFNVPRDPASLRGVRRATARKLHLLAVAICRQYWDYFRDDVARHAVLALERYVEKQATRAEVRRAARAAWLALRHAEDRDTAEAAASAVMCFLAPGDPGPGGEPLVGLDAVIVGTQAALVAAQAPATGLHDADPAGWSAAVDAEEPGLCDLIRDIFGNPYRPPPRLGPAQRSPAVRQLAEAIYADRTFDHLPVLADALEDAGVRNTTLLAHCRGSAPHARGCWVVDLVLGKK